MNGKISVFQFYSLLFLTRLLTTLTYIPEYTRDITVSDLIIQPLFRFVFGVIITLPVIALNSRCADNSCFYKGALGKVRAVLLSVAFFYFAVSTVARLDLFAGTVVFPETDASFLLLFVVAFCAYGAYVGLEAIGRSAVICILPVVLSLVLIFAVLVKKVDFLNLSPLFYNGLFPVVKTSVNAVGRTVEYAVFAAMLPKVTGNVNRGFFVWMGVQTAVTSIIFFFEGTVLGRFSEMQLFPVFTLASMAKTPLFHGLGAVITGVWLLCAFFKISLLMYCLSNVLSESFGLPKIGIIAVSGIIISVSCLVISRSTEFFKIIDTSSVKLILVLLAVPVPALAEIIKGGVKKCVKQ